MKKKLFPTVTCLLLVALCLVGCANYSEQFEKINKLLNANYSSMNLTVKVSKDAEELTSVFDVTYGVNDTSTIKFSVQRFATFANDGSLPDNYIETFEGSAMVKGSTVTSVSGDVPTGVELASIDGRGIAFNQNYFTDVKATSDTITANVSNPQAFLGQTGFACQPNSMVVVVSYHSLIDYIRIQYTSTNGATVVMMYTFAE